MHGPVLALVLALSPSCLLDLDDVTPSGTSGDKDGVYIEGTSGGARGGASLYGLAKFSDAVGSGTSTSCDVDPEFVECLLSDLTIFEKDFIGVSISESRLGYRGFHFRQVGVDSLPAAARFGDGGIVWEANALPLNSMYCRPMRTRGRYPIMPI